MTSIHLRRKKITWVAVALLTVAGFVAYSGNAGATTPEGYSATPLSLATFGPFSSHVKVKDFGWTERMRTKGQTDFLVKLNTWDPGTCDGCIPSTGWHTHPGPVFVTVTQGSVTEYDGDDPTCTPHVYTANTTNNSFIDPGDGHVHIVRDETGAIATAIAVQLVPSGDPPRTDEPAPGNCPF